MARVLVVFALVVCSVGSVVSADVIATPNVSLASLIQSDGSITIGDKVFSDFSVSSIGSFSPGAGDIYVHAFANSATNETTLMFQSFWSVDVGESIDSVIQYQVSVTDPEMHIAKLGLKATSVGAANGGRVSIVENAYSQEPFDADRSVADLLLIYNSTGTQRIYDEATLAPPANQLWVITGVGLSGRTGDAHLSQFYQVFGQVAMPEPATICTMIFGGMFLASRRRGRA